MDDGTPALTKSKKENRDAQAASFLTTTAIARPRD
jgi:hypothetical protein